MSVYYYDESTDTVFACTVAEISCGASTVSEDAIVDIDGNIMQEVEGGYSRLRNELIGLTPEAAVAAQAHAKVREVDRLLSEMNTFEKFVEFPFIHDISDPNGAEAEAYRTKAKEYGAIVSAYEEEHGRQNPEN